MRSERIDNLVESGKRGLNNICILYDDEIAGLKTALNKSENKNKNLIHMLQKATEQFTQSETDRRAATQDLRVQLETQKKWHVEDRQKYVRANGYWSILLGVSLCVIIFLAWHVK